MQCAISLTKALHTGNWVRIMHLLDSAPPLLSAAAQVYVPSIRTAALHALGAAAATKEGSEKLVPVDKYTRQLRFCSAADVEAFAQLHGLTVTQRAAGSGHMMLGDLKNIMEPITTLRQPVSAADAAHMKTKTS